jgi:hypothetical protein
MDVFSLQLVRALQPDMPAMRAFAARTTAVHSLKFNNDFSTANCQMF